MSGDTHIERPARLVRLLGDLDPVGRMARVLVEIDDPLGLNADHNPRELPLMLGAYVRVEIEGKDVEEVFSIPRASIREGEKVWIMDDDDRLVFRPVEVLHRSKERVLIRKGLEGGERIVTNSIPSPLPGMKLRTEQPETP